MCDAEVFYQEVIVNKLLSLGSGGRKHCVTFHKCFICVEI